MTTLAQIEEAHREAPRRRFALLPLAKVNQAIATHEDLELAKKLLAVPDGESLDKALGRKDVSALFQRGVIYFGENT